MAPCVTSPHPETDRLEAKQHVALKHKRGRWAGINSTTEGRETRIPEILSPCGAAALSERGSDDPLLSG